MTRDELRAALAAADGEGAAVCLAALDDPDVSVHAATDDDRPLPVADLLHGLRRRARYARATGQPAAGLDDAVDALTATPYRGLRQEFVAPGLRPFPSCTVLLAPSTDEVVAVVAVTGRPAAS